MRTPGPGELLPGDLLDAWERALGRPPVEQALILLAAACPDDGPDALAALPVGVRDGRLLDLRERLFGPELDMVAACPACGQAVEMGARVGDLRVPHGAGCNEGGEKVVTDGYRVAFRLADSRDLLALAARAEGGDPRLALLARCVTGAQGPDGTAIPPGALPEAVVAAVARRMADADPQAQIDLALACPACGHGWTAAFDILRFLLHELHGWAKRLLRDIHALASAYGWSEAEILALSPARRRIYLELCRS
jgi:hypothetical protein